MLKKSGYKKLLMKVTALVLSAVLVVPAVAVRAEDAPKKISYGDVNGDEGINAQDALEVLKHAAKISELAEDMRAYADVSDDGNIDAQDALWILKYAARLVDKFPVEEKEPEVTETAVPVTTVEPTEKITEKPTGEPSYAPTPTDSIKSYPLEILELNGADYYEEENIINYTASSLRSRSGVEVKNPFRGNKELIHDYGYLRDIVVEGKENVFNLTGSKIGWNKDSVPEKLPIPAEQLEAEPDITRDKRAWFYAEESTVHYPIPRGLKGCSVSYWAKTNKELDNAALLVFTNDTQTITVNVNGTVKYTDGEHDDNFFDAKMEADKYTVGEWHYYTITFANDWITVYIDGQEVPYDTVVLERDYIQSFNDGFLTRYNPSVSWTEEDYNDELNKARGYIENQRGSHDLYETITSDEYTVFGSGRFRGNGNIGRLLLSFMADESTKMFIGGTDTPIASTLAKYALLPETRVADLRYYTDELNDKEAAEIFAKAAVPDDSGIIEATAEPTAKPEFEVVELKVADLNGAYDKDGIYTFGENPTDKVMVSSTDRYGNVKEYEIVNAYGVEFENPFAGNERIRQTVDEALLGQTKFPYNSVAATNASLKLEQGNYGDTYYGDPYKALDVLTAEEKNPETAAVATKYHRPVYTKGATVGFWYMPMADADIPAAEGEAAVIDPRKQAPIFTMYGKDSGLFTMRADGSLAYFDMSIAEWKDAKVGYGQQFNGFFAVGNESLVKYNEWNYYTITFANDWIQVYINGQELIYDFVAMNCANKSLGQRFNAGFGTRYNPIGQAFSDPDPLRQYLTKTEGLAKKATETEAAVDNTTYSIRQNGIYTKVDGYMPLNNKGEEGLEWRLMMDALTSDNMKFYIGGCPTELALREEEGGYNEMWKNLLGGKFADVKLLTSHNQTGSGFSDVVFIEQELNAEKAYKLYEEAKMPAATPIPTFTPAPTADPRLNPITYDAETDTYTMHGQHDFETANNDATRNQSNAEYKIVNPFTGMDFKEEYTKNEEGMPVWTKGATISMWVYLPEDAFDAEILTFKLENYRQCQKDDYLKYLTCQAYTASDESYAMGSSEIYVGTNEDGTQTEYTVLSGYGSNVRYNPDYPAEGYYKLDDNGAIEVIKKGADPDVAGNWTKISNIGTGYYEGYSKRFEEEGGEKSKIREADIKGSLNIYASGTVCWQQDDQKSLQLNPNADKYGEECAMFNPSFFYHANGISQHWAPTTIFKETSDIPPVLAKKGQWHFFVVTIMNDWIQVYQDGVKLEQNKYINMNGAWLNPSVLRKSLKEFNLGYGYRNLWGTNAPSASNALGMLLTDYISYETTELYVGGYGVSAERAGINHIGTPAGVQIKDIRFYATAANDTNVFADRLEGMEEIAVK